jgi:SAM-dependent methyltransferase
VADLQTLPYADDSFDLVTGFRSFFFADDIVGALREARRVARPDAQVVIQVFGRPEHCDLEVVKEAAAQIGAAPPPDERERAHWRPIVEELARRAGLAFELSFDMISTNTYANDAAVLDAMLAAVPGMAAIAGPEQEPELHMAILRALAHRRRPGGGYCISNRWHTVIARA